MDEIHGVSEGDIVRVTDVSDGDHSPWIETGVLLEVRSITESVRGSKITVVMKDQASYQTVVSSTYEGWPNGVSSGHKFDADGYTTSFKKKYFDVEVVE